MLDDDLSEFDEMMNAKQALSYTACLLMAIAFSGNREDITKAGTAINVFAGHDDLVSKYSAKAFDLLNTKATRNLVDERDN